MPLRRGITTYFLRRFNLSDFADQVYRYSITDTAVVPPIITALLKLDPARHYLLRSLRYMICAGAPMDALLQAKLYAQLAPDAVIAQCWGTTETGWIALFGSHEKDSSGSVGRLLPNVHLK
jgi:acyl-coenzyme A synthetase/AMP-(fatty) acid ligase